MKISYEIEDKLGLSPVNYAYPMGDARRYGATADHPVSIMSSPEEYTRLRTIERAALALLVNRKDLGLIGQREALMSDLATAFGPIDPKQHKVKFP